MISMNNFMPNIDKNGGFLKKKTFFLKTALTRNRNFK